MALTIMDTAGPIMSAKISGELSRSEVARIQSAAIDAIGRNGKISAFFVLEDFAGWQKDDSWGDISFLTAHDRDIGKIAVVGDEQWRDFVCAFLAKGFRQAQVEYFLPGDAAAARAWLSAP